ncbi:DUF2637 domain-containing protein [Streptomyces sp. NPDC091272]|uniref:DUF2637 domain-containing protein n=1 Tax=Streptomyces sp. NPDC091272 TaxID=3365981 RepID=UPI0038030FBC
MTTAGFWLSYAHLAEVAGRHGLALSPARQWAWPATLDAFIVIGELLMLHAGLRRETDRWAMAMTATGSVGSIALNVAGVSGTGDAPAPVLDYVVAAVPPSAALLAFALLMRQVHRLVTIPATAPTHTGPRDGDRHVASTGGHNVAVALLDNPSARAARTGADAATEVRGATAPAQEPAATGGATAERGAAAETPQGTGKARRPSATMEEILRIGRTTPLGRDGVSRRKLEEAVRAAGYAAGRKRLEDAKKALQDELDETADARTA